MILTGALPWLYTSASAEERIALVIGNSAYTHTSALRNPAKDARDVAAALRRLQFNVSEHHDLPLQEMRDAVIKFGRDARQADMAVLYYAGHGMEVGGENWLIPVDAKLLADVDAEDEAIELSYLMGKLRGTRKLGLVILDACRNNPFSAKMTRTNGINRAVTRGFAGVEPEGNILVAYAAREGTLAQDGKPGENSPYATAILQHIETPNLDIQFIFRRVRDTVKTASKGIQIPHTYGSLPGQQIILNSNATGKIELNQTTKKQTTPIDACSVWPQISETKSIAQINAFLNECISGIYATLAKARLKEIENIKVAVGVFPKDEMKTREPVIELKGHEHFINSVAISSDGRFIVTGSDDKTARIWDANNGALLQVLEGHANSVGLVAISPNNQFIATASDKTIRIWNASNGSLIHTMRGSFYHLFSLTISPDGRFIVPGTLDHPSPIWSVDSGTQLYELKEHEGISSVAISPDSRFIVTGSSDGSARKWDARNGTLLNELKGHKEEIWSVAISPNSRYIITGSKDGTARVWLAEDGSLLHELEGDSDYDDIVSSLVVSPDSQLIITAAGTVTRIWNAEDGILLHQLKEHELSINSVAISSDGRFIVTGSDDKTARIWDIYQILGTTPKKAVQLTSLQPKQNTLLQAQDDVPITECDRLASDPWDPKSLTKGVSNEDASSDEAIQACTNAVEQYPNSHRLKALLARADYYLPEDETISGLKLAANSGNATALYNMAQRYLFGNGFNADNAEVVKWYQAAIIAGHADAMFQLGNSYRFESLLGLDNDFIKGFELIKKAAELNHPEAADHLSGLYLHGSGIDKNIDLGIYWLKKAAKLGRPAALGSLGSLYEDGKSEYNIPKDVYKAIEYHARAGERNYWPSYEYLIGAFDIGIGTETNPERAAHYLILLKNMNLRDDRFWSDLFVRLSSATAKELQQKLKDAGHYTGKIDGKLGSVTRRALDAYVKIL